MMNTYRAVGLVEGFEEGTEEERVEAMQELIDSGLAFRLQGTFGRLAVAMIEAGVCAAPARG
jgi:hypothetical protein